MYDRMKTFYMNIATECSKMSRAVRLQVGAVVVKDNNIISFSWNGTPAGWDNTCEDIEYIDPSATDWANSDEIEELWPLIGEDGRRYRLVTKPEVLHAERNALDKLAKGHESGKNSELYITHAPCLECAKSIKGAGIIHVYYKNDYRSSSGIEFLKKCGISVEKLD